MPRDAATSPTFPMPPPSITEQQQYSSLEALIDGPGRHRRSQRHQRYSSRTTTADMTAVTTSTADARPRQYGRRGPQPSSTNIVDLNQQRCCCLLTSGDSHCALVNGVAGGGLGQVRTVLLPNNGYSHHQQTTITTGTYPPPPGRTMASFDALLRTTSAKESAINSQCRTAVDCSPARRRAARPATNGLIDGGLPLSLPGHRRSHSSGAGPVNRLYCCPPPVGTQQPQQADHAPAGGQNSGQTTSTTVSSDPTSATILPATAPPPIRSTRAGPSGGPVLLELSYSSEERELFDGDIENHSCFRRSLPDLPMCVAVLFCILNCFLPGLGTFLASLSILFFGSKTEYGRGKWKRAFILCICASIIQMVTAIFVLGWVWSIMTGINFIKHSSRERERAMFKKHAYNFNNNHL